MIRTSAIIMGLSVAACLLTSPLTGAFSAQAQPADIPALYPALSALQERATDRAKGAQDAPVTFIEYASVACGHCADFHINAYEAIERGVAAGDVRHVFRPMITGQPNLAIAGFMLANCAEGDRYFDVIDVLFTQQSAIFEAMQTGAGQSAFEAAAARAGFINAAQVQACMSDDANLEQVRLAHAQAVQDNMTSTPSFIVNGDRLVAIASEDGPVYTVNGEVLTDADGPISAAHTVQSMNRIIALYKSRSEG